MDDLIQNENPYRVFTRVTALDVNYNMDFVGYLINQEAERRIVAGKAPLAGEELDAFKRELIAAVSIRGDVQAAINLRSK